MGTELTTPRKCQVCGEATTHCLGYPEYFGDPTRLYHQPYWLCLHHTRSWEAFHTRNATEYNDLVEHPDPNRSVRWQAFFHIWLNDQRRTHPIKHGLKVAPEGLDKPASPAP